MKREDDISQSTRYRNMQLSMKIGVLVYQPDWNEGFRIWCGRKITAIMRGWNQMECQVEEYVPCNPISSGGHLRFVSKTVDKGESDMLMADTVVWLTQNPFQTSSQVPSYRLEAEKW